MENLPNFFSPFLIPHLKGNGNPSEGSSLGQTPRTGQRWSSPQILLVIPPLTPSPPTPLGFLPPKDPASTLEPAGFCLWRQPGSWSHCRFPLHWLHISRSDQGPAFPEGRSVSGGAVLPHHTPRLCIFLTLAHPSVSPLFFQSHLNIASSEKPSLTPIPTLNEHPLIVHTFPSPFFLALLEL